GEQPERERVSRADRVLVNRRMTESLGFASPAEAVGKLVYRETLGREGALAKSYAEIIGVVDDSRVRSVREDADNVIYLRVNSAVTSIALKYDTSAADTIRENVERAWRTVMGDEVFRGEFVEASLASAFIPEQNEGKLL